MIYRAAKLNHGIRGGVSYIDESQIINCYKAEMGDKNITYDEYKGALLKEFEAVEDPDCDMIDLVKCGELDIAIRYYRRFTGASLRNTLKEIDRLKEMIAVQKEIERNREMRL